MQSRATNGQHFHSLLKLTSDFYVPYQSPGEQFVSASSPIIISSLSRLIEILYVTPHLKNTPRAPTTIKLYSKRSWRILSYSPTTQTVRYVYCVYGGWLADNGNIVAVWLWVTTKYQSVCHLFTNRQGEHTCLWRKFAGSSPPNNQVVVKVFRLEPSFFR